MTQLSTDMTPMSRHPRGNRAADPTAPRFRRVVWFVLLVGVTGCFGAPLEEETSEMNTPPYIAAELTDPAGDVVRVESDAPLVLSVDALLDPDPEDQLFYAVVGEHSGLIEQATSPRLPTDELYRGRFYQFEGVDIDIDPCSDRLRDHDDELVRLYVTDRPFDRVTAAQVDVHEQGYLQTHRWLLRFRPDLCSQQP